MTHKVDYPSLIVSPNDFPMKLQPALVDLVVEGSQVSRHFVESGIPRSDTIGIKYLDALIVSCAVIKNPLDSYRASVFEKAGVQDLADDYQKELGYISTRQGYEGNKQCQKLLADMMGEIKRYKTFATTRKPEMIHILKKFGFVQVGHAYDKDLSLLVFNG